MAVLPFILPPGLPVNPALFSTLLDLLPLGVMYYTPVVDGAGTLTDLALAYLNPAAQRITQLPAQPDTTYRHRFPTTDDNGAWDFHRRSWLAQEPQQFQFYYNADGFDHYFRVTAQRLGEGLLTIFTDTSDEGRSQVEVALRASQAREQERAGQLEVAQAALEREQAQLQAVLAQAPVAIALFQGEDLRFASINRKMAEIWSSTPAETVGLPLLEALPEVRGAGFDELLRQVLHTQVPIATTEIPVHLQREGRPALTYYNSAYQPLYNAQNEVLGVLAVAVEVTEQVLARQQVEQLNQQLEARVQERTQVAEQALAEAERQRRSLTELVEQAPAALCIVTGPDFRYEAFNPLYAAMFGGRPRVGRPMSEVLPEVVNHPGFLSFRAVYEEGRTIHQSEVLVPLARPGDGVLEDHYFSYTQQPRYDRQGQVDGVFVFAVEVTEQVRGRQQVEQLNQELEARVAERSQQLAQNQALLQQILRQLPAGVATFEGPTHRISFVNDRYQQLAANRVVLGGTVAELFPEIAEQGLVALLDQVHASGQPFQAFDSPARLDDPATGASTRLYLDIVYQPLFDARQQVTSILAFLLDVTEKVEARQQVEQLNAELEVRVQARTQEALALQADLLAATQRQVAERESFYQVFEQTTAAVALLRGTSHVYDYVNPTYQTFFPGRQLVGHSIAETVPEAAAQGFGALLDHVYQTGEPYVGTELPFVFPEPTAHTRYFNFTYQAYREATHVVGVSIFASDVTEQVLLRQQQQVQEQRLRQVFAQAPVAIFVLRGAGYVFEVVNASMGQLLQMVPDAMLGKGYFELLPALEAQGYRQLLDQVWHTGQEYVAQEQAAQLPHHGPGETGYYNFTYTPLREAGGHVIGILCVAVDVTNQVLTRQQVQALNEQLTRTNDELHGANQQLTRTNVDLDTFVYTASHDLKAPITNIESLVLALRNTLPDSVQQDELIANLLDLLDQTTARFQFTIAQLTDLSKLQLAHAGHAEPVNLAAVVEAVRLDLMPALAAADAQLTVEVAPALVVSFSPANLRSILYNLLSNAVKYRAPDRPARVVVRASQTGPGVVLEVQDNGLGLNAHQQSRLFGLFQRLHTHVEGTGVGLYITKRLVENGGGHIAVTSQPNVGTTFTVTLPT